MLKKTKTFIISTALALTLFSTPALASDLWVNEIKVYFNQQQPVVLENQTYLPAQDIFRTLGAKVFWHESTKTFSAEKDLSIFQFRGGKVYKNGVEIYLDTPPKFINGTLMLPFSFLTHIEYLYDVRTK